MCNERHIAVSAINENGQTLSKGAGLVKAPVQKIWAFATSPEKIKNFSRYLKDFSWDPITGDFKLRIEILFIGYELNGRAVPRPHAENPKIEFQVLENDLVPFTGEIELRSPAAQKFRAEAPPLPNDESLVRIQVTSAKDRSLSWPVRVGLEAVLQRTAGALREAVEAESR